MIIIIINETPSNQLFEIKQVGSLFLIAIFSRCLYIDHVLAGTYHYSTCIQFKIKFRCSSATTSCLLSPYQMCLLRLNDTIIYSGPGVRWLIKTTTPRIANWATAD